MEDNFEILSYYKQEGTTKTVYYMESYGKLHLIPEGLKIHSVRIGDQEFIVKPTEVI